MQVVDDMEFNDDTVKANRGDGNTITDDKNNKFTASVRRSFVVEGFNKEFFNEELEELDNDVVYSRLNTDSKIPSYIPGQTKL